MVFKLLEIFMSDNESEDRYEFSPARGLVLCFPPRLRAHVIVIFLIENNLSLVVFKEKVCVRYGSRNVAY